MSDHREEQYKPDRLGNLSREVDAIKAQDGMSADDGIATVASGETGTEVTVKTISGDARGEFVDTIKVVNTNTTAGTFTISSSITDSAGAITGSTQRTVTIPFEADELVEIDYSGREFSDDVISINASAAVEVGISTIVDHREELEP